ncbi:MAG: TIGR01906 family membrane protein [Oscillospiraceae bacterium]|jgi:integral membrane protein (TIGR01906 family)|nr:TIGR01906 family membrane protein [Oscillospiraceae bacterium]
MKRILLAALAAVLTLLAATGLGLGFIHITDLPYTVDVGALNIEENTGLSRDEIMDNYNAVMRFLSPFREGEFDLPTLKYTATGAQHFVDCKVIFNWVYIISAASLVVLGLLLWRRALDRKTLKYSGLLTMAIPLAFALALLVNFDRLFVVFHAVFFEGDTWIFDPKADEIINILPSEFFMHCALVISLFWVLAATGEFVAGSVRKKGNKNQEKAS